ncbi:Cof-type HAD-IIB family hydrolase [Halanaerobium salsuginis]|jgi:hypothetical protein|uniref:Cof subfamily of IIB subfamily of haloacid dehalogenase superfamily/HAD-superfamily hydrolase, subfamily IIB n=1 Tax=Halanaerobium salsuginis TaxID=29563 RepID=A0A1I4NCD5_9FIRM|nr:Cof-type HAD-IIB family hydrolase [Halanaerobium salsuginis]SFM12950.1 hypothetical protein SAMN02983006_02867 [Halanaerobium salsuginis]
MVEHKIRLIISDIDGTILDEHNLIDNKLKENVGCLKRKNIPFVLASARSPRGIFPIAKELEINDSPIACYNGAFILEGTIDNYATIISHEINKTEINLIVDLLKSQFPTVSINLYSKTNWYVESYDKWAKIEASITKDTPVEKNLKLLLNTLLPFHKLLLIDEAQVVKKLLTHLNNLNLPNSAFYLSKDNYLEVTAKNVSKEKALLELADYYNVPLENIMAIGDNYNDIPMLSLAGLGVVMDNAPLEVKKAADIKTSDNTKNGVSNAIIKYVLT